MSHVWEKLQDTDHEQLILSDTESMMGEKLPFLKELKPWIAHFLQLEDVRILVCDKESRDQSALIESVLNLVQSLALFGYYSNPKEITVVRANPFFFFLPLPFFHHLSLLLHHSWLDTFMHFWTERLMFFPGGIETSLTKRGHKRKDS